MARAAALGELIIDDEYGEVVPEDIKVVPGDPSYDRQLNAAVQSEIDRENGIRPLLEGFVGKINFTTREYCWDDEDEWHKIEDLRKAGGALQARQARDAERERQAQEAELARQALEAEQDGEAALLEDEEDSGVTPEVGTP